MSDPLSSQGTHLTRVCYPASKQLPRRPSHRDPSNVASPTKNPIMVVVVVTIKVHDIGPLKKSG
jgi:hypothetical protein